MKNKFFIFKRIIIFMFFLVLFISVSGNIIGYIFVYLAFDKYNDSRLYPYGEKFSENVNFDQKYDVVILGDSLAENWEYDGNNVLNLGIGGQTSSQIKLRSDMYKDELKGDKLIIIAGGNDIKSISTNKKQKDKIVNNVIINIESVISNHQNNFDEIYLLTMPPIFKIPLKYRSLYSKDISDAHSELNENIRNVAKNENIILIDTYKILHKKVKNEKLSDDGIHINRKAYEYLEMEINKY